MRQKPLGRQPTGNAKHPRQARHSGWVMGVALQDAAKQHSPMKSFEYCGNYERSIDISDITECHKNINNQTLNNSPSLKKPAFNTKTKYVLYKTSFIQNTCFLAQALDSFLQFIQRYGEPYK
jgi:hypothetical protein